MKKRFFALMLCLSLLLPMIPAARAAAVEDLRAAVEKQYDAYAASIYQDNAADKATDQMLKYGFYGNGKTVHMTQKDPFAASLYQSNLFRTFLVEAITVGAQIMQDKNLEKGMFGSDSLSWHDFELEYRISEFVYDETPDRKDDRVVSRPVARTVFTGQRNEHDTAMILVVGGSACRIRMTRLERDYVQASYRVEVTVSDEFEFDGNYTYADKMGYDTTFSKLIASLGPLLGMDEFFWDCVTAFDITVPLVYSCPHTVGDFRWAMGENGFGAVSGDGLSVLKVEQVEYEKQDGSTVYYYKLERPVELLHDVPWVLEFRQKGSKPFILSQNEVYTTGEPYFLRTHNHMHVGHYLSEEENKGRHQYGYEVVELGYKPSQWHTFRIENRIAEDGTNMLWLLVDGTELGPMDSYFYNPRSANIDMETKSDWAGGRDFTVGYIGNKNFPILGELEYVAIWQDGTGAALDPMRSGNTPASCTEPGLSLKTCMFCGYTETAEATPALGHAEETVPGKAASCTGEGLTDGTECAVCGEVLLAQEVIPALGHREEIIPAVAAACTQAGLTEGRRCALCGEILLQQETVPTLGHSYEKGACLLCGEKDPDFLPGDVDGNGELTYQDALTVLRASVGLGSCDIHLGDMDGDGKLTYEDALRILRASIGL